MGWNKAAKNFVFALHSNWTLIWHLLICKIHICSCGRRFLQQEICRVFLIKVFVRIGTFINVFQILWRFSNLLAFSRWIGIFQINRCFPNSRVVSTLKRSIESYFTYVFWWIQQHVRIGGIGEGVRSTSSLSAERRQNSWRLYFNPLHQYLITRVFLGPIAVRKCITLICVKGI